MEKGLTKEQSEKALTSTIPGLKITKSMFRNTILVVALPDTHNEEQAMANLKGVKGVKYSELDGVVGISPVQPEGPGIGIGRPRPQIQPRTSPRKLGKPQIQPRR